MSTRHLISPSRLDSLQKASSFQLQPPPPHRHKENRKCRVISKRDEEMQESAGDRLIPPIKIFTFQDQKRCSTSEPLLACKEDQPEKNTGTNSGDDQSSVESQFWESEYGGGIITSSVKCDLRNSAFFGDSCIWSPKLAVGYRNSPQNPLSASRTSSFHSVARSTFGATTRRRSSQHSIKSPKSREGSRGSNQSNGDVTRHMILQLSPMTPLTPRTIGSLHTPSDLHFDLVNSHSILPLEDQDAEPLSATLKRIGAVRKTMKLEAEKEALDGALYCPSTMTDWERSLTERLTSQRRAGEASRANRQALNQAEGLLSTLLPQREELAKVEQDQPSSWLNKDPPLWSSNTAHRPGVQSTPRGSSKRALSFALSSFSTTLTNHLFRSRSDKEDGMQSCQIPLKSLTESKITRPNPTASRTKGDGWGGLRPRSSWFPDLTFGPLVSPASTTPIHLRPLHLQPMLCTREEDAWIDENEEPQIEATTPFQAQDSSIGKLRVHFPAKLPKPSRDGRPLSSNIVASLTENGTIVKYTDTSAEGILTSKKSTMKKVLHLLRSHGGLLIAIVLIVSLSAFVAVVGTSAVKHAYST